MIYVTKQGDTFDVIALHVYGRESLVLPLLDANPMHAETVVFSAGVALEIPEANKNDAAENLPPWRRGKE